MSEQHQSKTITIAGAGFSGTCILATQIRNIRQQWQNAGCPCEFPQTEIIIADSSAYPGAGHYKKDGIEDIALLNQPAYAMSPFVDDPAHFTNWLCSKLPHSDAKDLDNSFQKRHTYGEYLRDVFQKSLHQGKWGNFPVTIHHRQSIVSNAFAAEDGTWQIETNEQNWTSDKLIIADGHHKNDYLHEFENHSLYFDGALSPQGFETLNDGKNKRILIIGGGQSMMDRFAELLHYGYKGEINAVSRRGVLPWLFNPHIYRPNYGLPAYQFKTFTVDKLSEVDCLQRLNALWEQEIFEAETNGYGPGHVLGAFFNSTELKNFSHPNPDIWQRQIKIIEGWYANPTSPERFNKLFQATQNQQFLSYTSSIKADSITDEGDEFFVQFDNGYGTSYDAIFNGASYARGLICPTSNHIRSPLIERLDKQGYINWQDKQVGLIHAGLQTEQGLYYAGPYSYTKWGVETFREQHAAIACHALDYPQRYQFAA